MLGHGCGGSAQAFNAGAPQARERGELESRPWNSQARPRTHSEERTFANRPREPASAPEAECSASLPLTAGAQEAHMLKARSGHRCGVLIWIGRLAGWLAGMLAGWLAGWLDGLAGWLAGWLTC